MSEQMDLWGVEATQETKNILAKLCEKLVEVRNEKDEAQKIVKEISERESKLEAEIINHMKENSLDQVKGAFGSVSLVFKKSIRVPENLEEKIKLFKYLKEQGLFEQMASINANTLNSWARKEIEAKEEEGLFGWVPPGLKPPTEYADIRVTRK